MTNSSAKNKHYAQLRRNFRDKKNQIISFSLPKNQIFIYGFHSVLAALKNKKRIIHQLFLTKNAFQKLENLYDLKKIPYQIVESKFISQEIGSEPVHQGVLLKTETLKPKKLENLKNSRIVLLLDQITDPHNVGAIMRSAVAFNVDAIISTKQHRAPETATLAKSASGALDAIDYVVVKNLAETILFFEKENFQTIGLDSEAKENFENILSKKKIALVLGAEGKGLRNKTRETVQHMAHLEVPGTIISLNVSNAAAITMYETQKFLKKFQI